jgi:hypothetical protein
MTGPGDEAPIGRETGARRQGSPILMRREAFSLPRGMGDRVILEYSSGDGECAETNGSLS